MSPMPFVAMLSILEVLLFILFAVGAEKLRQQGDRDRAWASFLLMILMFIIMVLTTVSLRLTMGLVERGCP